MNLETWLEEQNVLTVGEEPNSCIKLLDAQEQVWATWSVPVKSETVHTAFASMAQQLATGRHAFALVSFAVDGEQRARYMHTVSGGSSAAKAAQTDEITRAKATAMNIDIADKQLQMMSVRLEQADARAAKMEERAGENIELLWKLADRIQEHERDDRRVDLEMEEKKARIELLKEIGGQVAPLLGLLMPALLEKVGKAFAGSPELPPSTDPTSALPAVSSTTSEPRSGPEKPTVDIDVPWPDARQQQSDEDPPTEVVVPKPAKGARRVAKAPVKPAKAMPKKKK